MKKTLCRLSALFLMLLCGTMVFAQDDVVTPEVYESDVNFTAILPTAKHLTAEQKTALQKKVEKIIARANAGVVTETNAFGIDADVVIKESKTSAGLLRDVSLVIADVTLTAKNIEDGSVYYSNTIEVQADAIGKEKEAVNTLINNIKVTDPAFVRFIRTARKRVVEFYNARGLPLPIRKDKEPEVVHDTVQVENTVIVTVPVEAAPVEQTPAAKPAAANGEVKISTANLDFKIVSCEGDMTRDRITIVAQMTNYKESTRMETVFQQAFDGDGNQLNSPRVSENYNWEWIDVPLNVPMKREFYIKNVTSPVPALSYLKIKLGSTFVEVRNLNVNWR